MLEQKQKSGAIGAALFKFLQIKRHVLMKHMSSSILQLQLLDTKRPEFKLPPGSELLTFSSDP